MRRYAFAIALALVPSTAFLACSDDSSDDDTSSNGSGASSSSTGPGPGSGGSGNEGGSGASGATGGTGSGGEASGGNGSGGGVTADHLLISELSAAPVGVEFIEIHNPTAATVDLSDYYLSDTSLYYEPATGAPFDPIATAGSDFLARFPAGTTIAAGDFIVIALKPEFEAEYDACPDFILADADLTCAQGTATAMELTPPVDPGPRDQTITLSDDREMVVLFTWDGNTSNPVQDVDYLTWGTEIQDGSRADKTGVAGYQADTPVDQQNGAPIPADFGSIERCPANAESGETASGGNGIDGHDETSEQLSTSFALQGAPTPGAANGCN